MRQGLFTIEENLPIARSVFRMRLRGDTGAILRPGQFVNVALEGFFLRRPISVCDWEDGGLTLVFKAVGQGTEALSRKAPGERLDLLTGLGNGFDLERSGPNPLLVGGGVGTPPLLGLARRLVAAGAKPVAALGFASAEDAFGLEELSDLGVETRVATADGSLGEKGLVTGILPEDVSYFYACGPIPMLAALSRVCPADGEVSLEERMGCGFGACMGCSQQTRNGSKRVCREGPVFRKEEVIW